MSKEKYTKELLQHAAENSLSFAGVLRQLGLKQAGGTQSYITSLVKRHEIDTRHFTGSRWNKGRIFTNLRKKASDILVISPTGSHRTKHIQLVRAMIESGINHVCALCLCEDTWNGISLTLEVDHIDGNSLDNRIENLRFLCPNCHSQQTKTNQPHKYASISQLAEETSLDLVNVSVRI